MIKTYITNALTPLLPLLLAALPFIVLGWFYEIREAMPRIYLSMLKEDSWLENLQAVLYFFAGLLAIAVARCYQRVGKNVHAYVVYTYAFIILIIAAEEISWGQRIFQFGTPDWFSKHNAQREFNFHNLRPIHVRLNTIYQLFSVSAVCVCLFLKYIPYPSLLKCKTLYPPWWLATYFATIFWHSYDFPERRKPVNWGEQEIAELIIAAAFLLYSLYLLHGRSWRLR